jgi:hypothetical protein
LGGSGGKSRRVSKSTHFNLDCRDLIC